MLYLDKEDKAKGLPEDCKMAPFKDPLVKIDQLLAPRPRTGTPTYLAIDLLDENPPPHAYRHELESFFRSSTFSFGPLYTMTIEGTEALDAIRPEFQSLRKEWIEPLYWLIRDARRSVPIKRPGQEPPKEDYDKDTYGGRLTFRTFMAANKSAAEKEEKKKTEKEETKQKDN